MTQSNFKPREGGYAFLPAHGIVRCTGFEDTQTKDRFKQAFTLGDITQRASLSALDGFQAKQPVAQSGLSVLASGSSAAKPKTPTYRLLMTKVKGAYPEIQGKSDFSDVQAPPSRQEIKSAIEAAKNIEPQEFETREALKDHIEGLVKSDDLSDVARAYAYSCGRAMSNDIGLLNIQAFKILASAQAHEARKGQDIGEEHKKSARRNLRRRLPDDGIKVVYIKDEPKQGSREAKAQIDEGIAVTNAALDRVKVAAAFIEDKLPLQKNAAQRITQLAQSGDIKPRHALVVLNVVFQNQADVSGTIDDINTFEAAMPERIRVQQGQPLAADTTAKSLVSRTRKRLSPIFDALEQRGRGERIDASIRANIASWRPARAPR